jgi:Ca2+-binding EF-hand superfamily protein
MKLKHMAFLLRATVLAAVMAVPAAVDAQRVPAERGGMRFASMDMNSDGVISRAEWRGSERSFANHDWNNDGQLSGPEVQPGAQRNTNWEQADHIPNRFERYASWTEAGFNNLDHNRDRRISANEWHFDIETFRRVDRNGDGALEQNEFLGGEVDDARADTFDDLDWNNNGRVEQNEWYGSRSVFSDLDRNRDGVLTRFEVAGGVDTPYDTWDEFASLDYNRNGAISRDEWHWSAASFNRQDANRDGVLSRQEFSAAGGGPDNTGEGAQRAATVRVNGQDRWTDTGIMVRAGDTISLDASGSVQLSDTANDTATPAGSTNNRRAPDAPFLNQLAGGLIARIDNYGPIFLGGRRTFTVPVSGHLYFGVNDDHLPDNRGEFVVNVSVAPR